MVRQGLYLNALSFTQWHENAVFIGHVTRHFTRFHPSYRLMNLPATPIPTLERVWQLASAEGLHFVYLGNVPGHAAENTYCPGCKRMLIRRVGMATLENRIRDGRCPDCKRLIPGVWA